MTKDLQDLINTNGKLAKYLNFEWLKKHKEKELIRKITVENLIRYKNLFPQEKEFKDYLLSNYHKIFNIYKKTTLNESSLNELHYELNKFLIPLKQLSPQELWTYRNSPTVIIQENLKWKKVKLWTTSHKKLKTEMEKLLALINSSLISPKTEEKVIGILTFTIQGLIIHPYSNGNGKLFWILNDILLLKANFLPIFGNKNIKEISKNVFSYYAQYQDLNLTLKEFIRFINKIYKNYKF